MQLEQSLYSSIRQEEGYTPKDLGSMSASALYTIPLMPLPSPPLSSPRSLTIRPFTGFQLHIHEEPGGIAHIKYPNGTYTEINSYDAAMADLLADNLGIKKILKKYKVDDD